MTHTIKDVLDFVKENDVKFIRLNFCDLFGMQKNISIMPDELLSAFENGVSFDAHSIRGFRDVTQSDLFLYPDPASLVVLPWRPGPGRVIRFYCDVKKPDGEVYEHDTRIILKRVVKRAEEKGFFCKIGAECEFYLFKTDEDGEPTKITLDKGGYLDISPLDKSCDVRREICLTLDEMGIKPETSHHEQGPGQNEVDFKFSDALASADNLQTFKSVVKAIAGRNGLFASFMPKPLPESAGSGMHVNLSITQNGLNIFKPSNRIGDGSLKIAESFIAGILEKTAEMTLFLNPIANSYERIGKFDAPKQVSWSHQNRSQLIRIPATTDSVKARMELRSPDPSLNPYLSFALLIAAGLDGVENELKLLPATEVCGTIPDNLDEAIVLAQNSDFIKGVFGDELLTKYIELKKSEPRENDRYFNLI